MKYLKLFENYEENDYYKYLSDNEYHEIIKGDKCIDMSESDIKLITEHLQDLSFRYIYTKKLENSNFAASNVVIMNIHATVDESEKYPSGPKWIYIMKMKDEYFLIREFHNFVMEEDKEFILCDQIDAVTKWIDDNVSHERSFVKRNRGQEGIVSNTAILESYEGPGVNEYYFKTTYDEYTERTMDQVMFTKSERDRLIPLINKCGEGVLWPRESIGIKIGRSDMGLTINRQSKNSKLLEKQKYLGCITKCNDEWFVVKYLEKISDHHSQVYYKCDQIDGLEEFITEIFGKLLKSRFDNE